MLKKWLIRVSVLGNVLAVAALVALWFNTGNLIRGFLAQNHERQVSFFETFDVDRDDVVFLGDSITAGGEWNELFPAAVTRNRGIGGDTTTGVLARLQQVTTGKPAAVFLMIGTNDLTHGPQDRAMSYRQYREIVTTLQSGSPAPRIYLQSILPRAAQYRDEVEAFNTQIQALARELDVAYVDLYPEFLQADGSIDDAFSNDELHLNGPGYQKWQTVLKPLLAR